MRVIQVLLVAAFVIWAMFPVKKKLPYDQWTRLGILFGTAVNLVFAFLLRSQEGTRWFERWHLPVAYYLPGFVALPLIFLIFVVKSSLRGNLASPKWGVDEAKSVLAQDTSLFRRALAHVYLLVTRPAAFFMGWALGSLLFVEFIFDNH